MLIKWSIKHFIVKENVSLIDHPKIFEVRSRIVDEPEWEKFKKIKKKSVYVSVFSKEIGCYRTPNHLKEFINSEQPSSGRQ